jgi:hypothetical protein
VTSSTNRSPLLEYATQVASRDLGRSALSRFLKDLEPLGTADALVIAGAELRQRAGRLEQAASATGVPVDQFVRNLHSVVPSGSLPMLGLLLVCRPAWAPERFLEWERLSAAGIKSAFRVPPAAQPLARRLARWKVDLPPDADTPLAAACALLAEARSRPRSPSHRRALLTYALQSAATRRIGLARIARAAPSVVNAELFRLLPPTVRLDVLADPSSRQLFLDQKGAPLFGALTQPWVATVEQHTFQGPLAPDVRGSLPDPALQDALAEACVAVALRLTAADLSHAASAWPLLRHILCESTETWPAVFDAASSGACLLVLHRLPVERLTEVWDGATRPHVRRAVAQVASLRKVLPVAVSRFLSNGNTPLDLPPTLDDDSVWRAVLDGAGAAIARRQSAWIAPSTGARFLRWLAVEFSKPGESIERLADAGLAAWIGSRRISLLDSLVARALRRVSDGYVSVGPAAGALVAESVGRKRDPKRWLPRQPTVALLATAAEIAATAAPSALPAVLQAAASSCSDRSWGRVLSEHVARMPAGTRNAITNALATSPDLLRRSVLRAPALLFDAALSHLGTPAMASLALRNAVIATRLDATLTPAERFRQPPVPDVTQPTTGARGLAVELATLVSFRDLRLLQRYARQCLPALIEDKPARRGRLLDGEYTTWTLPKRSGGTRTITVPSRSLKRLQRRLLAVIFDQVPLHEGCTGFRRGHSILTNAARHVGKPLVVNADIESCFPSTTHRQILRACRIATAGRLSPMGVRFLAELCSFGGALPTGAPTSPAIANIVLTRADRVIAKVAAKWGITYSRYADDLTFSGEGKVHGILPFVRRVLAEEGYAIAEQKVNLFRRGRRQVVTGLVVNEKPNLPRRIRRRLRAAVHARANGRMATWHGAAMSDASLRGHLGNLSTVQPAEAARLVAALDDASGRLHES